MSAANVSRNIDLSPRKPLLLEHAVGCRVTVARGTVWLTQYGDARDIILGPGQSFDIDRPGCLLTTFDEDVRIALGPPEPAAGQATSARAWRWPVRWDRAVLAFLDNSIRRLRLG